MIQIPRRTLKSQFLTLIALTSNFESLRTISYTAIVVATMTFAIVRVAVQQITLPVLSALILWEHKKMDVKLILVMIWESRIKLSHMNANLAIITPSITIRILFSM